MESNLTTAFMACKAVLPHMIERGTGVIVNLTSKNVARRVGLDKHPMGRLKRRWSGSVKRWLTR